MSIPFAVALVISAGLATLIARRATRGLRRDLARLMASRRAQRRRLADVDLGPAAVSGRVVPIDLVRSLASDREGVYVRTTCERWDDLPNTTGVGGGKWVVAARDEQAAPFELEGVEGQRVLVDPAGADFWVPIRLGASDEPSRRFQEAVLEAGADVVVLGEARREGGFESSSAYRGHTIGTVVAGGRDGLLIALRPGLRVRLLGSVAFHGLFVLPAVALGMVSLVYVLGNAPASSVSCAAAPVRTGAAPPRAYRALPWRGPPARILPPARARPRTGLARAMPIVPERVGELTLRLQVLGVAWPTVRRSIAARVRRELWRRRLSWLSNVSITRRRRYLIFDEIVVRGVAVRDRQFWRSFCALHPRRCAAPTAPR